MVMERPHASVGALWLDAKAVPNIALGFCAAGSKRLSAIPGDPNARGNALSKMRLASLGTNV